MLHIVTNAYRQVHLLYLGNAVVDGNAIVRSQMPIGKYIYCTNKRTLPRKVQNRVTNAYRQVHLLYPIVLMPVYLKII